MTLAVVIADDLTGALDTGVQFSNRGLSVGVITDHKSLQRDLRSFDVLVVDTESRHLPPDKAAQIVSEAGRAGHALGAKLCYKKVDSTLRGNIGAELTALLDGGFGHELMFIPAFPELGRTVQDGMLLLDGKPIGETEMKDDPINPMGESEIKAIIAQQSAVPVETLAKPHSLPPSGKGPAIYLFDSASRADLQEICEHLASQDRLRLTAGSAGFAGALADYLAPALPPGEIPKCRLPLLVVSGSLNPVSRRQAEYAADCGFEHISISPEYLVSSERCAVQMLDRLVQTVSNRLNQGRNVIVETGATRLEDGGGLTPVLGRLVKDIIDGSVPLTLVLFGGDTAIGVLNALQVSVVIPQLELAPGTALSRTVSDVYGMQIITKAGGFGSEDLLVQIHHLLKG